MNVLALDLGTHTGACWNLGQELQCETWILATAKEIRQWGKERTTRTRDPRVERLCSKVSELPEFDVIIFEDVQFASYTKQVQLWSALRSAVWLCGKAKFYECVPVQTLKKFATGAGNATKEMMIAAVPHKGEKPLDDNAADAYHLWSYAHTNLKRMKF